MKGLKWNPETRDLVITSEGTFSETIIDSQNCMLIAMSQVCRITRPEIGTSLGAKIINRPPSHVGADIAEAIRAVETDGGTDVQIYFNDEGNLEFKARYDS